MTVKIIQDDGKKYLIGDGNNVKERPDIKMLLHNKIQGFLPLQLRYIDEDCFCYYDVEGLQSMEKYLETKGFTNTWLPWFYEKLIETLEAGKNYFLQEEHCVISLSHIYWDSWKKQLYLCYFPDYEESLSRQIVDLTENLLAQLNHSDKKAVSFLYGLYDLLQNEGFVYDTIRSYIRASQEVKPSLAKKSKNYRYQLVRKGDLPSAPARIVLDKSEIAVGRQRNNEIVFPYGQISRRHARFIVNQEQILVIDCESTNGTFLNGKKIPANRTVPCKKSDVVAFADISYGVEEVL